MQHLKVGYEERRDETCDLRITKWARPQTLAQDLKDCCSGWASLKEIWPDPKAFFPLVWQRRRRNIGSEPRARRAVTLSVAPCAAALHLNRRSEGNYGGNSSQYMIQVGSGKDESLGSDRCEAYTSNWVQYFI